MLKTLLQHFNRKGRARKALLKKLSRGVPEFGGEKTSRLIDLVSRKDFSLFLEYLELTISENLVTLSSIDLLDDKMRASAVKLQNQTRGVLAVRDLVEDLIYRSRELAKETREKEDERNN